MSRSCRSLIIVCANDWTHLAEAMCSSKVQWRMSRPGRYMFVTIHRWPDHVHLFTFESPYRGPHALVTTRSRQFRLSMASSNKEVMRDTWFASELAYLFVLFGMQSHRGMFCLFSCVAMCGAEISSRTSNEPSIPSVQQRTNGAAGLAGMVSFAVDSLSCLSFLHNFIYRVAHVSLG